MDRLTSLPDGPAGGQKKQERHVDEYKAWPTPADDLMAEIAGRKRIEEQLKGTRLRLERSLKFTEALLSAVPVPVFYKDVEGRYLGCNRAFSELMGVTSDQLKGKTVGELWPCEYAEVYHSKDLELIRNPARQVYDFKVVDKDGAERPVIYVKDVFRDENDQVAGIVGAFIDITGRKRAETELRESEARFRAIFDSVNDAIFIHDLQTGAIVDVNSRMCEMYGYTREEALRIDVGALGSGEPRYTRQDALAWIRKAAEEGPQLFEWRTSHKSGRLFWVEVSMRRATLGSQDRLLVVVRDITERKRAEEALKQLTRQDREALRIAHMGHWEFDVTSRTFLFNDQFYKLHGTTAEEAGGYTMAGEVYVRKYVHPDYVDYILNIFRTITTTTDPGFQGSYEGSILRADGEPRYMSAWFRVDTDEQGRVVRLHGVNQDITERKQAEDALKSSRQILANVLENFPGVVFWKDRNSVYLGCNRNFSSGAGLADPAMIAGRDDYDRNLPWKDDAERYRADDRKVMESGVPELNIIEPLRLADGRVAWFDTNKIPLYDRDGKVIGVLGTSNDITERLWAEHALEKAKEQAEYEKSQAEIYLDLMGHDINNMHQICMGYLELALTSPDVGPGSREMIATSIKAINSSTKLIENVKKLRRMKEGSLKHHVIDVGKLLDDILPGYACAPGRDISISYAADGNSTILANDLLEDVFSNVIGNAIKHSAGPLIINICLDRIDEDGKNWCRVSIADNGPGIPDSVKEKLFTRFRNVGIMPEGSGLGLYLVKALVDGFGGTIRVEDRVPGDHTRGSRFVIKLPAVGN